MAEAALVDLLESMKRSQTTHAPRVSAGSMVLRT